jgi:hypothetical protein
MAKMKSLTRSYVWWPGIDKSIESRVQKCTQCHVNRKMPPKTPLHQWEPPSGPWERIHIDHVGPILGKMYLVMIDAYSKWFELHIVKSTSSEETVKTLRMIFATHGLSTRLVSDNGS